MQTKTPPTSQKQTPCYFPPGLRGIKGEFSAFTLVELIVVITILVILSTIAFLNLGGFQSSARDANRIENLTNLKKGLDIFQIKSGKYPLPENPINITASGTLIGYQGFAKEQIGSIANLSSNGTIDPLDSTIYTTYSTNADRTKMQVMSFLEDGNNVTSFNCIPPRPLGEGWAPQWGVGEGFSSFIPQTFASSISDYSKRFPRVIGDSLGILLGNSGATLNQPIQELYVANSFIGVDILTSTGGIYNAYVSKSEILSGTGLIFISLLSNFDNSVGTYPGCDHKDIKLPNGQVWAACNVGASKVYNGVNQPLILSNTGANGGPTIDQKVYMGAYFQWGRNKDITTGNVTTGPLVNDITNDFITNPLGGVPPGANYDWLVDSARNDNLWGGFGTTNTTGTFVSQGFPSVMQGPCPINYHIPTTIEWCNALNSISPLNNSGNIISCNSVWYTEATPNLFRMVLKLPLAGIRYSNAAIYNFQDTTGFYWTSSPYASSSPAGYVRMSTTQIYPTGGNNRVFGLSIRCLKN